MLASTVQFSNNTQQPLLEKKNSSLSQIIVADQTLACNLRCQQCTEIAPRILPVKNLCWRAIVSVPPMSNRVLRSWTIGLWPHTTPDNSGCVGRCSLERR